MYDSDDFRLGIYAILIICFWLGLAGWGLWELIDWLWINDTIRSFTPIKPEIELIFNGNVVDTIYVYREP